ncbi:MAG: ATP-binding cassette domain-containing protein [Methanoregulaceae archaeon]|nr:ATP-binding cassette domain-containing protein [Methanoregulaceae archaeon]
MRFEQVTKRYGTTVAVDNLDLEIHPSELFVLIGPSGSGKTTMLRMVNRMVEPDEGRILINDVDIQSLDPVELRRATGYVIQQIGLFPHMTVAGNIGLVPALAGMPDKALHDRIRQLLSLVKLPPDMFMDRYPRELSGGQQQRVGLARSLAMDPPLLLMDEPFGALDPVLRHQLGEEFLGIKAHVNKTILFVTHDVEEAFRLGDRVGVVAGGRLIRVGTPEDLIMDPGSPEVASLIGVEQKMRYRDLLKVRSLMIPVDPSRILDVSLRAGDARKAMIASKAEYLLAGQGGVPEGIIFPQDLLAAEGPDIPIGDILRKIPVFDSSATASDVLSAMKGQGASTALVFENGRVIGLVVMDEIVRLLL